IGLVNWVCPAADLDRTLQSIVSKVRAASPTAAAHTKRLLHESFHRDPRAMIEDVVKAQNECMHSWEMDEANRAWRERREAVFYPPRPSGGHRRRTRTSPPRRKTASPGSPPTAPPCVPPPPPGPSPRSPTPSSLRP